jgi:hypothetical protein
MHWWTIAAIGFAAGALGGMAGVALFAYCLEKLFDWFWH